MAKTLQSPAKNRQIVNTQIVSGENGLANANSGETLSSNTSAGNSILIGLNCTYKSATDMGNEQNKLRRISTNKSIDLWITSY